MESRELRDLGEERPHRPFFRERQWSGYAGSVGLVCVVSVAGLSMQPHMARTSLAMLYLLAVAVSALRFGIGPAVLTGVFGSLIFSRFFTPDFWTKGLDEVWYLITFVTLLVVGVVISALSGHAREQARKSQNREKYTAALYSLSRSLAGAGQLDQILRAIGRHMTESFHRPMGILLPEGEDLRIRFRSPDFKLDEADWTAAGWALRNAKKAGPWIPESRGARICFLPLQTWRGVLGVLGIRAAQPADALSREQWDLLEGFVSQAASAIERALLAEEARQAQVLQEGNKLQKALLNTISHNLRTPLASITGVLSGLLEDQAVRDTRSEREMLETALGESERLNRVVANLLDMTRLETGGVGVKLEPVDIQEVLGTAFEHLGGATRGREIRVHIEPNLPLVDMDAVLIAQVFVNLIDNALKYSAAEQPVFVRARADGDNLEVQVEDRGIGIAMADQEKVFDRFYRAPRATRVSGMGLGLSICRRFVEAHGGSIRVSSVEQSGTTMTFLLPLAADVSVEVANGRSGTARISR